MIVIGKTNINSYERRQWHVFSKKEVQFLCTHTHTKKCFWDSKVRCIKKKQPVNWALLLKGYNQEFIHSPHSSVKKTMADTSGFFRINFYTEHMCNGNRQSKQIHVFISKKNSLSTVLAHNLLPKVQFETSLWCSLSLEIMIVFRQRNSFI